MPKNQLEQNWFLKLEDILQIIGLIESKGKYFSVESKFLDKPITTHSIEDLLTHFSKIDKSDFSRTIRNAKTIFNSNIKGYQIQGDKQGTYIVKTSDGSQNPKDFKENPSYKTLLLFVLAIATYKEQLDWAVLHQLFQQEHPLAVLCFLMVAIEHKFLLDIDYYSDRKSQLENYKAVPCKIISRDGHWLLIVYNVENKDWVQLLIHSIQKIHPVADSIKQIRTVEDVPVFDAKQFYKHTFSIAKLNETDLVTYVIRVPKDRKQAIVKRKSVGKWENQGDHWLWKVDSYDEMEVFDYIFRWDGVLELVEPKEKREKFQAILQKLQSIHK